ncbi:hypothetical protein D9619_013319 [Psilocybe cf. subviscida]|uniref:Uncharacterized protein n=1 Tax=Psilocybe cf. subviscida TaxID=2480587 RepID=A0A8H5BTT7_9AGAR|nr:hypothetical protein D9619_013319 [Psilocybe cf. subviscida]
MMFLVLILVFWQSNAATPAPALSLVSMTSSDCTDHPKQYDCQPPWDQDLPLRPWYAIGQSCLVTIIACIWTSGHPNINGPMDSWWTCTKRRVVTMLCAFIAPGVVLYWAFQQMLTARAIALAYNREFATQYHDESKSLWAEFKALFHPLPKEATRRGGGQAWTITHGFFVQMGGFLLYEKGYPTAVLDYGRLEQLLRNGFIAPLSVTEGEIQDRSKGNAISKSLVVFQTLWFVLQCCARWSQHLPVSELEAMTLAFAVLNGATYAVWWDKPQGVGVAICLHLKERADDSDQQVPYIPSSTSSQMDIIGAILDPGLKQHTPLFATEQGPDNLESHMLWQDKHANASGALGITLLPHRLAALILRPILKMLHIEGNQVRDSALRVPMFYAPSTDTGWSGLVLIVVGSIFGAVHLLVTIPFSPSNPESILWLVCSAIMTVTPISIYMTVQLDDFMEKFGAGNCLSYFIKVILKFLYTLVILSYVGSRFTVIVLALRSIQQPPPGILLAPSWTSYIPHL